LYGMASIDIHEARAIERSRGVVCASIGDEWKNAWQRAPYHVEQHGEPGSDVLVSRPMDGGRGAGGAGEEDKEEDTSGKGDGRAQVVETRKRLLGRDHSVTLSSMANLALTYSRQRQWKEAEDLGTQVVETSVRMLGEEHPETLTGMNNLAYTWKDQGRDADAIKLMQKCVELRTRVLGVTHSHTCSSSEALASWRLQGLTIDDDAHVDSDAHARAGSTNS
jgi:hypothetical protein